ncbi:MAG: hypothetical protein Q8M76_00005, partial [Spirochaetaceae bacterium]|nr:hypothetical protein [Spirochaetaceae bacterium]
MSSGDVEADFRSVDAQILGRILAAQNLMFILPDEKRIAQYYSQAMSAIPGILSCGVCLGCSRFTGNANDDSCCDCPAPKEIIGEMTVMPRDFRCRLAERPDARVIALRASEHTLGFFIFRIDSS